MPMEYIFHMTVIILSCFSLPTATISPSEYKKVNVIIIKKYLKKYISIDTLAVYGL